MKKLSFFKKLGLGLTTSAAILPIALVATSCSQNGILSRYVTFKNMKDNIEGYVYSKMEQGYYSTDELLLGSGRFCDGNYIMFVGSNMFDDTLTFFFQGGTTIRDVNKWFIEENSKSSILFSDVQSYPQENIERFEKDFGFTAYIDNFANPVFHDKQGREIYPTKDHKDPRKSLTTVGPFDKWNDEGIISETKKLTKDIWYDQGHEDWEWDDDAITTSDYIRQDDFAKAYRAFCERGAIMFPTTDQRTQTFDTADENKTSLMVIYKDGKLVEIVKIPTAKNTSADPVNDKESTTVLGAINKWFVDYDED